VEPRAKPAQKPLLTDVADRIAGRIGAKPDVESDRGSVRGELADRRTAGPGFQAFNAGAGQSARVTYRLAAESGTSPCASELANHPCLVVPGDPDRPRDRAIAVRHPRMVPRQASLALIRPLSGRHGGSALEERLNGPEFGPSWGGMPDLRAH
jgi:hypothetical protein